MKDPYSRYGIDPIDDQRLAQWCFRLARSGWLTMWFAGQNLKSKVRIPPGPMLRSARNGFLFKSHVVYRLHEGDPNDYIADYAKILKSRNINGVFNYFFKNKLGFNHFLQSKSIRAPELYACTVDGRLYGQSEALESGDLESGLKVLLDRHPALVFKPAYAGGGKGIFKLEGVNGGWAINGVPATIEDVRALIPDEHVIMITEFVPNAPYAASLYPETTNTLRILTVWDDREDAPFIAAACHRIGTSSSGMTDNFHGGLGGLSANVDVATGRLGSGATLGRGARLEWHARHPETGAPIEGVAIPGWSRVRDELLDLARSMPYARSVGWDCIVQDDGWVCLEGNSPPSYLVWQVHQPLLVDPRVRAFYERYGMTRRRR